jgi:hypothetical protein
MTRQLADLCVSCLVIGQLVTVVPLIGDETPAAPPIVTRAKPSTDDIDRWVQELNAPEFSKREEATRRLLAAGAVAAEPLVKAAQSSSLETTCRINTILRTWYTSGKEELIEPAEVAFEQLKESKNRHIASRADATLEQFKDTIRQDRALAEINKLGGSVKELPGNGLRAIGPGDSKQFMVILGRDWRGGDDGLKYVRRLSSNTALYLLHNRVTEKLLTPGVTPEAVEQLRRDMPRLTIAYRGPAFLGISPQNRLPGCYVGDVSPDSPAAKAKIRSGDVVTKFGEKPVSDFEELVMLIQDKQPGDKIKIEVLRGDEEEILFWQRLQSVKDPAAKEQLDKLHKRLAVEIEVTLAEWGSK